VGNIGGGARSHTADDQRVLPAPGDGGGEGRDGPVRSMSGVGDVSKKYYGIKIRCTYLRHKPGGEICQPFDAHLRTKSLVTSSDCIRPGKFSAAGLHLRKQLWDYLLFVN